VARDQHEAVAERLLGVLMSKRMAPVSVMPTSWWTFEREPPGWPLCRWFSMMSMNWSMQSAANW
jgi:hypothetical protein